MAEVVCNTSPLQYLYQVGLLDLLPTLYGNITIPQAVGAEITMGRGLGVQLPDIESLQWIRMRQAKAHPLLRLAADLGPGEREVLALTLEWPGSLAMTRLEGGTRTIWDCGSWGRWVCCCSRSGGHTLKRSCP